MKYVTTTATDWYTASGSVGNAKNRKIRSGYEFDSTQTATIKGMSCHHETGTNRWIPASYCKVAAETDTGEEPTADNSTYMQVRYSPDGITWGAWITYKKND